MSSIKEFSFKVINPKKPKILVPSIFDLLIFIGWIFYIIIGIRDTKAGNLDSIFVKTWHIYGRISEINLILGLLAIAFIVSIPIILSRIIFRRFLLKYYLSEAKVKLCEDYISVEFINPAVKYCFSQTIYLNELKSYAISKAITAARYRRGRGLIPNMGIRLVNQNEKTIFRLIDTYRLIPFGSFDDLIGITEFSEALKEYIDNYNLRTNNSIEFHVPTLWKTGPRTLFIASTVLGAFLLFLFIWFSITLNLK